MSGLTAHYLSLNGQIKDCPALLGIEERPVEDALDLGRYMEEKAQGKALAVCEKALRPKIRALTPPSRAISRTKDESP